ncbi:AAA family ATPase [Alkalihalobacterium bogoriense]|uniref:AAA family ATPase n=1 Tax=Alkalihalobacterium bogoriense TaxID=246272 RepID=UPI000684B032|nr:AAA family ATPase [Alkalihalobacterium bogoriense]
MIRFILYTYKDREEFENYYRETEEKGNCISPFIFQETKELLEENSASIIDISSLVQYLSVNTADIVPAMNNFLPASEETQFIILEHLSEKALDVFRHLFKEKVPLYPTNNEHEKVFSELKTKKIPFKRITCYSYEDSGDLEKIIEYLNSKEIPLISFSQINEDLINDFIKNVIEETDVFVDITSMVSAIKDNSNLAYYSEKIFIEYPNLTYITHTNKIKEVLEIFRLIFNEVKPVNTIIPIENDSLDIKEKNNIVKIIDLPLEELNKAVKEITNRLFGHKKFKDQLLKAFYDFILLNRINEKKVFSIFLLGDTGLGKTEFAKLLKDQLYTNTPLVKINFGNYSSQDALNSLIGSPRGYIGSEEGELSNKILKSKAGVILCDEFEKANNQIVNFFLELLEDGKFTDTLSREHDVNGYIIIFTSNIDQNRFYKEMPKEFQSRLDLVCEFNPLSEDEKKEFVNYYVDKFIEKIKKDKSLQAEFTTQRIQEIKNINVTGHGDIRDIKRLLSKKILEHIQVKGIL